MALRRAHSLSRKKKNRYKYTATKSDAIQRKMKAEGEQQKVLLCPKQYKKYAEGTLKKGKVGVLYVRTITIHPNTNKIIVIMIYSLSGCVCVVKCATQECVCVYLTALPSAIRESIDACINSSNST